MVNDFALKAKGGEVEIKKHIGKASQVTKDLVRNLDAIVWAVILRTTRLIVWLSTFTNMLRPSLHIIMLTVYVDNDKIFKSLQAGANGYLIKQTAPAELLAAIADVQSGGAPMTNTIARRVVQYFQERKPSNESENLTQREQEILDLIAQGYRDKEMAEKLSLSVRTVGTHIRNIYEKLHVHSRTEAVFKFFNK